MLTLAVYDKLTPQIIKDWMLALAVLLLCVVDLIILVVYTAVEGATGNLEAKRVINTENPMEVRGVSLILELSFYTEISGSFYFVCVDAGTWYHIPVLCIHV